jgi:hypothetical protein
MEDHYEKIANPTTKKAKSKKAKSEETPSSVKVVRANRRQTRRHTAHVPGPRRKPTFSAGVYRPDAKEEAVAEAPAEAEASDEGDAFE